MKAQPDKPHLDSSHFLCGDHSQETHGKLRLDLLGTVHNTEQRDTQHESSVTKNGPCFEAKETEPKSDEDALNCRRMQENPANGSIPLT